MNHAEIATIAAVVTPRNNIKSKGMGRILSRRMRAVAAVAAVLFSQPFANAQTTTRPTTTAATRVSTTTGPNFQGWYTDGATREYRRHDHLPPAASRLPNSRC
jgi:hypothetical protein